MTDEKLCPVCGKGDSELFEAGDGEWGGRAVSHLACVHVLQRQVRELEGEVTLLQEREYERLRQEYVDPEAVEYGVWMEPRDGGRWEFRFTHQSVEATLNFARTHLVSDPYCRLEIAHVHFDRSRWSTTRKERPKEER